MSSKYNPGDLGSKFILTPIPKTVDDKFPIQEVKNKEILDLSKKMKTADLAKYLSKKFKFSKKEIYQKILMFNKK